MTMGFHSRSADEPPFVPKALTMASRDDGPGNERGSSSSPTTGAAASLVRVGDCVTLAKERRFGVPDSEGGTAFVTAVHDDGTFDVRYVLGLRETSVAPRRIGAANPLAVADRRVSNESLARPSLLAPSRRPESQSQAQRARSISPQPPAREGPSGVSAVLQQSHRWSKFDPGPNPLLKFLSDARLPGARKREAGWLRTSETQLQLRGISLVDEKGNKRRHRTEEENNVIFAIKRELDRDRVSSSWPSRSRAPTWPRCVDSSKPEDAGAGYSCVVFGYACSKSPEPKKMPLGHVLAMRLAAPLAEVRRDGALDWILPDGKAQVVLEYGYSRAPFAPGALAPPESQSQAQRARFSFSCRPTRDPLASRSGAGGGVAPLDPDDWGGDVHRGVRCARVIVGGSQRNAQRGAHGRAHGQTDEECTEPVAVLAAGQRTHGRAECVANGRIHGRRTS